MRTLDIPQRYSLLYPMMYFYFIENGSCFCSLPEDSKGRVIMAKKFMIGNAKWQNVYSLPDYIISRIKAKAWIQQLKFM